MRLISYTRNGVVGWGILEGDDVRLLSESPAGARRSLGEVLRAGDLSHVLESTDSAPAVSRDTIHLLPPIIDADKIICIGLNYADHIAEMNRPTPEKPVVFTRFNNSLVGHDEPLLAPAHSEQFDYEGEFTIVIGTGGRNIPVETALDHVLGYTIMNDGSVRDYQRHTHQFTPGKNFPRSGSLGPCIVTADEFGAVTDQAIETRIDGEILQRSSLDQLVFGVAELVSYCSEWCELSPGDIIATGTPGGVGDGRDPKRWMRAGETVEVEVEGIGILRNRIEDDS